MAVFLEREGVLGPAEDFAGLWIDWPEEPPLSEAPEMELVEAVRQDEGRVFVGFEEPESTRLAASVEVRERGRQARLRAVTAGSTEEGRDVVRELGGRITRPYRRLPMVAAVVDPEVVPELRAHPLVSWVEPAGAASLHASPTELAQQIPYNLDRVRAPAARTVNQGDDATVWILDTGTFGGVSHHSDLPPLSPLTCRTTLPFTTTCVDSAMYVDPSHGTGVAGVALALDNTSDVVGVAPDIELWGSIRVCDSFGVCPTTATVDALMFLRQNTFKDVINMSYGDTIFRGALAAATINAWDEGDLMVATAGNEGMSEVLYPAAHLDVIAVSGTDQFYGLHPNSNYGPEVELAAPFTVLSLANASGTDTFEGTSFAAPAVSGAAALVWTQNPTWTNAQVRSKLQSTAEDIGGPGRDDKFGFGMLDAGFAVGVPQPLTATITGPSTVRPGEFCTWQVALDGLEGSPSYQWSGVFSGTGPFVSGSLFSSGTLSVSVQTSGGQNDTDNLFITVSSSAPLCEL